MEKCRSAFYDIDQKFSVHKNIRSNIAGGKGKGPIKGRQIHNDTMLVSFKKIAE